MSSSQVKFRRCKYFENDGTPIGYGCPRPSITCAFAHPADPDWDRLTIPDSVGYKQWNEEQRSPSSSRRNSSYYRDRDRDRDRRRSPSVLGREKERGRGRRDSVASTSHSHTRSLSHDTRGTSSMNADRRLFLDAGESDQDIKPILSKSGSIMDSPLEMQRPVLQPIVTTASAHPEHPFSSTTTTVQSATYAPHTPSSVMPSSTAIPPSDDPPVPPPPPLPAVPELNTTLDSAGPLDAESQAKVDVWETRIKRLVDSALAQESLLQAEEDLSQALSITQSTYFPSLSSDIQLRAQSEITDLQSRRDDLQKAVNASIEKLLGSDCWPPLDRHEGEERERDKENKLGYEEVKKYVEELKGITAEMSRVLGDMSGLKPPPTTILQDAERDHREFGVPMDVDDAVPPLLLSTATGGGAGAGGGPSHEELEYALDRVVELENTLSNIRNHLDARYDEFEDRIEEFRAAVKGEEEAVESVVVENPDAEDGEVDDTTKTASKDSNDRIRADLDKLIAENDIAGRDIGELSGYITEQIQQESALTVQLAQARVDNERSLERFEMLQRQFTGYAQAREKDTQTLRVLEAALKAYTNSTTAPPSPPLSPSPASLSSSFPTSSSLLTSEYLIQALQDPITDILRAKMKPLIQDFRDSVEALLKEQNAEMYGTIWERMKGALILLRTISDKLEVGGVGVPGQGQGQGVVGVV